MSRSHLMLIVRLFMDLTVFVFSLYNHHQNPQRSHDFQRNYFGVDIIMNWRRLRIDYAVYVNELIVFLCVVTATLFSCKIDYSMRSRGFNKCAFGSWLLVFSCIVYGVGSDVYVICTSTNCPPTNFLVSPHLHPKPITKLKDHLLIHVKPTVW